MQAHTSSTKHVSTDLAITLQQKKEDIIGKSEKLDVGCRKAVLTIINFIQPECIVENGDGCRIDLDRLSENTINRIHEYIITQTTKT